jgi:hypothetical protein
VVERPPPPAVSVNIFKADPAGTISTGRTRSSTVTTPDSARVRIIGIKVSLPLTYIDVGILNSPGEERLLVAKSISRDDEVAAR